MKFLITRKCQYTETLEVEAESKAEALEKSQDADFERCNDDVIVDERTTRME